MRLAIRRSAILSAIIFNALIIIALIPLALSGVRYRPIGAAKLLQRNLLIYGLGGIVAPFIGIKIDRPHHHRHRARLKRLMLDNPPRHRLHVLLPCCSASAIRWRSPASPAAFPHQANGSLVTDKAGHVVGSALLASRSPRTSTCTRARRRPRRRRIRPDQLRRSNYGPLKRSDLGPTRIAPATRRRCASRPVQQRVPDDAITTSASGLDPDISPADADLQGRAVAKARGASADAVRQ